MRFKAIAVVKDWGSNGERNVTLIGTMKEIREMVLKLPGFVRISKFTRIRALCLWLLWGHRHIFFP